MQINRDNLLSTDYETLFKKDPGTFFEFLVINILWDKDSKSVDMETVQRQRYVFLKWLEYYDANKNQDLFEQFRVQYEPTVRQFINEARTRSFLDGQIHALNSLPIKKNALGKSVNLNEVVELLRKLKAQREGTK